MAGHPSVEYHRRAAEHHLAAAKHHEHALREYEQEHYTEAAVAAYHALGHHRAAERNAVGAAKAHAKYESTKK